MECEFPQKNATDETIEELLRTTKTIAVVGLSAKPDRDSHRVAKYLLEQGYTIYPVNPGCSEVLGLPCHSDLHGLPGPVDIVDIFRAPEYIPAVVDQAIEIGARAVWMQLGLAHNKAAEKARAAGLTVVMSKCTKIEHMRMLGRGERDSNKSINML